MNLEVPTRLSNFHYSVPSSADGCVIKTPTQWHKFAFQSRPPAPTPVQPGNTHCARGLALEIGASRDHRHEDAVSWPRQRSLACQQFINDLCINVANVGHDNGGNRGHRCPTAIVAGRDPAAVLGAGQTPLP